jgi:hypothetical protein
MSSSPELESGGSPRRTPPIMAGGANDDNDVSRWGNRSPDPSQFGHTFNGGQGGMIGHVADWLRGGATPVNPSSMPGGSPNPQTRPAQGGPGMWLQNLFSGMGGQYGG